MKSNKDTQEKETSISQEETTSQDQPSWYHYVIIVAVVLGIIFSLAVIFEIVDRSSGPDMDNVANQNDSYMYKYKRGNVTYNIELSAPVYEIKQYGFTIEPTRYDILNTVNFRFSFDTYNGTDNGQVSLSAIKLRRFLTRVYFFDFDVNESFVSTQNITCDNSTSAQKVVTFNPRANESGVFVDENGCFMIKSTRPNLMPFVVDDLILNVVEE